MSKDKGWIGVDLDGTLAHYERWVDIYTIGAPVPAMLERVKRWLAEGRIVKIMTARVAPLGEDHLAAGPIREWCRLHVGQVLPITCVKDGAMIELWDDRCVAVEENTGVALSPSRRGLDG